MKLEIMDVEREKLSWARRLIHKENREDWIEWVTKRTKSKFFKKAMATKISGNYKRVKKQERIHDIEL